MQYAECRTIMQLPLPAALLLTIPGFYLVLDGTSPWLPWAGQLLYGLAALLCCAHLLTPARCHGRARARHWRHLDRLLLLVIAASIWPSAPPWSNMEWLLRLLGCAAIFARLLSLAARHVAPRPLLRTSFASLAMLLVAGAGFYWLEPHVHSFGDGLWLAFTTGATVGYGDIVPSTPASRILAVFIVLLGYAVLSLVTASIAAVLVGEDEKRLRRELHADMRLLQHQITLLREEIAAQREAADQQRRG